MKIILIKGYKRAGKDYVANLLKDRLDNSTTYSFASPIKTILAKTFNMSEELLDVLKNEEGKLYLKNYSNNNYVELTNFREILQRFGTEAMKPIFGESVWVDTFLDLTFKEDIIIIPDWRFKIEKDTIVDNYRNFNVITIEVKDNNLKPGTHASENEIKDIKCDYDIDNTNKDESIIPIIDNIAKNIKDL